MNSGRHTDPEGDSCFSIYQIRWIKTLLQFLFLKLSRNDAPFFSPFAKQWISKDIPSYGSQSKRAKIALHWITDTFEMFVCCNIRNVKSNYLKCIGSQCFPLPCVLFFLSNFDGRGTRVSMIPCSQVYNDTAENTLHCVKIQSHIWCLGHSSLQDSLWHPSSAFENVFKSDFII